MKILVVVDMQNDFIDGALGTAEAQAIVENVKNKILKFEGMVLYTRDTHSENYNNTQEGRNLPVPHCIKGTTGWQIHPEIAELVRVQPIDKPTFGSMKLAQMISEMNDNEPIEEITLIGLCTDICVISNAMILKAQLPEVPIVVDASCCAGVSVQSHEQALASMKACQIRIDS